MAIRVAFFNGKPGQKRAEFDVLPVENADQYRCVPADLLSYDAARHISLELSKGLVNGWIEHYRWYRQAGGGVKNPEAR